MVTREDFELICRLNKNWTTETIKVKRAGGETNKNYLVRDGKGLWCVRLPLKTDTHNREEESLNIKALMSCGGLSGISPNYCLYLLKKKNILLLETEEEIDLPDGTAITEYIDGQDLNADLLGEEKVQRSLAGTLYIFHASRVKFVNSYDPFEHEISKYKKELGNFPVRKLVNLEAITLIEEKERVTRERLPLSEGISTHNDLILDNLRLGKDGRVCLLDFEYAGVNTRGLYYDFGTLLGENLFLRKPLNVTVYKEVMKKVSAVYEREFDLSIAYCAAMVNVILTFWWGLNEYAKAVKEEDKEREKYFEEYVPKRVKKIEFLRQIIEKR